MDELYKTLIKEARHKRVLVVSAQLHGSQKEVKLSFGASAYMYDRCRCNDWEERGIKFSNANNVFLTYSGVTWIFSLSTNFFIAVIFAIFRIHDC